MNTKLVIIRHGMTAGNMARRYIGSIDESLCREGSLALQRFFYPSAEIIFSSPMKRCLETAEMIWPEQVPVTVEQLQECDFGTFEGRTWEELLDEPVYQEFLKTGKLTAFPEGEHIGEFKKRCCDGFDLVMQKCISDKPDSAAMVVHGGTIMAILEHYAYEQKDYYDWQVPNGAGYIVTVNHADWLQQRACIKVTEVLEGKDK